MELMFVNYPVSLLGNGLSLNYAEWDDFYEVCGRWIRVKPKAPCLFETLTIELILQTTQFAYSLSLPHKESKDLGQKYRIDRLEKFQDLK